MPLSPPEPGTPYEAPAEGSLQLLALGEVGLRLWRTTRDGAAPPPVVPDALEPSPRPRGTLAADVPRRARLAKKVLLVGWDAADWKVIDPLLEAGKMPALARLLGRGARGSIATLDPPFSPMLWTSVATGKTADLHNILYFVEPNPEGDGVRPVLGSSRHGKALWNILTQAGLRSNVVGWWPSHPAEPIDGVMVSDFWRTANAPLGEPWPPTPGAVHPEALADRLAALRVHPGELTAAHLLPFVPRAAEIDQDEDRKLHAIAKIVARTASVHAAATWAMRHTEWDLTAVYYDALDALGHGFMKYHPPRQPHVPEEAFAHYNGVVAAGYQFFDLLLHRLLDLAGEDATVILLSDHGFHSDHLRPAAIPKIPAGPAVEHRPFGVLGLRGPHVRRGEPIHGASLLDITPTVLTLFGLPVGRDMRGKPLAQAFNEAFDPTAIPSWEAVGGEAGLHPAETRRDPWAEREAMAQLVALGYVEAPGGDAHERVARTVRERQYHLARVFLSTGRTEEAVASLEAAVAGDPEEPRYGLFLAQCYRRLGRLADAHVLADRLAATHGTFPMLRVLQAQLALRDGRPDEALAELQRLHDLAGADVEIPLQIGSVLPPDAGVRRGGGALRPRPRPGPGLRARSPRPRHRALRAAALQGSDGGRARCRLAPLRLPRRSFLPRDGFHPSRLGRPRRRGLRDMPGTGPRLRPRAQGTRPAVPGLPPPAVPGTRPCRGLPPPPLGSSGRRGAFQCVRERIVSRTPCLLAARSLPYQSPPPFTNARDFHGTFRYS